MGEIYGGLFRSPESIVKASPTISHHLRAEFEFVEALALVGAPKEPNLPL